MTRRLPFRPAARGSRWTVSPTFATVVFGLAFACLLAACHRGDNPEFFDAVKAPEDAPRLVEVRLVDGDDDGIDGDDVIVLTFDRDVILLGSDLGGFVLESDRDSFGEGALLRQSVPGSALVEMLLGENPQLLAGGASTSGVSRVNIADSGAGVVLIEGTNGILAGEASKDLPLLDATAAAPELVEARYVDTDGTGTVNIGDRLVLTLSKPVSIPGAPPADLVDNFTLPVTGDQFGAGATVHAATSLPSNLGLLVTLGSAPVLAPAGTFSASATTAGSPSGITVDAAATFPITDTLSNPLATGSAVEIETPIPNGIGQGREAELVLGAPDAFTQAVNSQGLAGVAGVDFFSGTITLDGDDFLVDLLFVADRGNDRVLIFADFPSGSFAAASWVLGQPDLSPATSEDPTATEPPEASASALWRPEGVAFDAATNRLYVADTGNHRVLVWQALFFVDTASGAPAVGNGAAASFVLGQSSMNDRAANRGGGPSASSFSSPAAVSARDGRLLVADRGNHRVLIFGSLPDAPDVTPAAVLGQADFASGAANRGAVAPDATTLSDPSDVFLSLDLSVGGSSGAVLVADSGNHRLLAYGGDPATGAAAVLVLGQADFTSGTANRGGAAGNGTLSSPQGVVADATAGSERIYVADRDNDRVVTYDASAGAALASGDDGAPIGGSGPTGADTLRGPERVAITTTALIAADTGNHRILVYDDTALPTVDRDATLVLGQPSFTASAPNGRRFHRPSDVLLLGGRLIVADAANHRVLIYQSAPLVDDPEPDLVLGQADFFGTLPNRGGQPSASTLHTPTSVATDGARLAVADTGNHRVLVWSSIPVASGVAADVILGQSTVDGDRPNAARGVSERGFHSPEGLAIAEDQLLVADRENHRVLIFDGFRSLTDFSGASQVLGQGDFEDNEPNRGGLVSRKGLRFPRDVLMGGRRLYVADSGNHRVLVWDEVPTLSERRDADGVFGQNDFESVASAPATPGNLLDPSGLAMDPSVHLLAVADTGHHRVVLFDRLSGDVEEETPDRNNAAFVLGQTSLSGGLPNQGKDAPGPGTLKGPRGLLFNGYELIVADQGNSRLIGYR